MDKSKASFRIGQVTDVHLELDEGLNSGLDSVKSFERILDDVSRFSLDLLVLTGDLTEHGFEKEYLLFQKIIKQYHRPWCVIAGNHDDSENMVRCLFENLKLENGEFFFQKKVNGFDFFFLDSSKGFVSRKQLDWLLTESEKKNGEIFLFMHHPPCLCGHLFMDSRYALKNWKEVGETLDRIHHLHSIFVGHYHSDMTIDRGNGQMVYVTPATQMQLDPDSSEFKILSESPGWRLIEYSEGKLSTELRYL